MALHSKPHQSMKHIIISKANTVILVSVSVAVFIVIFCLFAIRALYDQGQYHSRVIAEKEDALKVAKKNSEAVTELQQSYVSFAKEPLNVLGGNPIGEGPNDGDNAKLVLDALPARYDYPAVASSIEKILVEGKYNIKTISGQEEDSDDTTDEVDKDSKVTTKPSEPVEIPFPFKISASPDSIISLLKTFESSIRPFSVTSLELKGQDDALETEIGISTYYQPKSGLQITDKDIK